VPSPVSDRSISSRGTNPKPCLSNQIVSGLTVAAVTRGLGEC
jgi:hypothetical protein